MKRVAVYTAIFGGFDELRDPRRPAPGVDFHCFTDDPTMTSSVWNVHAEKPRFEHPRMAAKYYRALPHKVLPQYRRSVWIDGGVTLLRPRRFVQMAMRALDGQGIALFRHPDRGDIASEADISLTMPKYAGLPLKEQVDHYYRQGFPDDFGLFATGIIARDHGDRKVRRLGRLWLRENVHWTYQDQISMPYLLWKLDISPGIYPYDLWTNPFMEIASHAHTL